MLRTVLKAGEDGLIATQPSSHLCDHQVYRALEKHPGEYKRAYDEAVDFVKTWAHNKGFTPGFVSPSKGELSSTPRCPIVTNLNPDPAPDPTDLLLWLHSISTTLKPNPDPNPDPNTNSCLVSPEP